MGAYAERAIIRKEITVVAVRETIFARIRARGVIPTAAIIEPVRITVPKGRAVMRLQWYQGKSGYIPTAGELASYRTEFTPGLKSPQSSKEWQLGS